MNMEIFGCCLKLIVYINKIILVGVIIAEIVNFYI